MVDERVDNRGASDSSSTKSVKEVPRSLQSLSYLMDESIKLPGGYRIGWDGIIGLIPGLGDLVGLAVSAYIILRSASMGTSKIVIARMSTNVAFEAIVGSIPILGDIFDFLFKANKRNMKLLQQYSIEPGKTRSVSKGWMGIVLVVMLLIFVTAFLLVVRIVGWAWGLLL